MSAKADGGDATLVRPVADWNNSLVMSEGNDGDQPMRNSAVAGEGWELVSGDPVSLINQSGGALAVNDVVAISAANDEAVKLDDVSGSLLRFVVSLGAPANTARGPFCRAGVATAKSTGTIARGQFIRKSATTKTVEDTGIAANDANGAPDGTIGESLAAAVAGTVKALFYGVTFKAKAAIAIDRVTTDTTFSLTTIETTIYTKSIPGGTLSTNVRLRLQLLCRLGMSTTPGTSFTLRLKYGATTLVTSVIGGGTLAGTLNTAATVVTAFLTGDGATNTQHGFVQTLVDVPLTDLANLKTVTQTRGTAAENSTGALTLAVTGQYSGAEASNAFTMESAILEQL